MPRPGQQISNPITGERIVFKRTTRQTDGVCLSFDVELRPGAVIAGAPHHHPFEERMLVTRGRLGGWIAGEGTFTRSVGERLVIPAHRDHVVVNASLGPTAAEVEAFPGGGFDHLLETAFAFSRGRLSLVGEMARDLRREGVMVTAIPESVQRRLLAALSSVGSRAEAG